jgi:hypothetical protein
VSDKIVHRLPLAQVDEAKFEPEVKSHPPKIGLEWEVGLDGDVGPRIECDWGHRAKRNWPMCDTRHSPIRNLYSPISYYSAYKIWLSQTFPRLTSYLEKK